MLSHSVPPVKVEIVAHLPGPHCPSVLSPSLYAKTQLWTLLLTVLSPSLHSKTQLWTLLLTVVAASRDVVLSLPSCLWGGVCAQ